MLGDGGKGEEDAPDMRAFAVKEVAAILRACTATVYAMVERGELPHARVRNSIRILVAVSETALDGRPVPR